MRLIDADVLPNYKCQVSATIGDKTGPAWMRFAFWEDIEKAPTIDAVPVVRCRECEKFWEYTESHKATVEKADGDCMIRCMVAPDDPQFCAVQKDDYCSMGKRKGAKMDGKEG